MAAVDGRPDFARPFSRPLLRRKPIRGPIPGRTRATSLCLAVSACTVAALAPSAEARAIDSRPAARTTPARTAVVSYAKQFLGTPYRWGGASPGGFDCSGLTSYVYAHFGVKMAHYTGAQFAAFRKVSRGALQPGDLVFFDGLGHTGIYIGRGRFIHATHSGDVVRISRLSESWYRSGWAGAVRPPFPSA